MGIFHVKMDINVTNMLRAGFRLAVPLVGAHARASAWAADLPSPPCAAGIVSVGFGGNPQKGVQEEAGRWFCLAGWKALAEGRIVTVLLWIPSQRKWCRVACIFSFCFTHMLNFVNAPHWINLMSFLNLFNHDLKEARLWSLLSACASVNVIKWIWHVGAYLQEIFVKVSLHGVFAHHKLFY